MGQEEQIKTRFGASYIVAFVLIIGVTIGAHTMDNRQIRGELAAAEIINISGAQRMLSQRTFALVEALTINPEDDLAREFLADGLSDFASAHARLSHYVQTHNFESQVQSSLLDLYFNPENGIDALTFEYVSLAESALDRPLSIEELARLESMALGDLIDQLHAAVGLYQEDAEAGLAQVDTIAMVAIAIIFAVLVFEALFIFFPLIRSLVKRTQSERHARQKAEIALDMEKAAQDSKARLISTLHGEFVGPLEEARKAIEMLHRTSSSESETRKMKEVLERLVQAHEKADFMIKFYSRWKEDVGQGQSDKRSGNDDETRAA